MTAHINPVAVTDLARYITEVTKRNEFLEVRVQELLESNNGELVRWRSAEKQVQFLTNRLLGVVKPETTNGTTKEEAEGPGDRQV